MEKLRAARVKKLVIKVYNDEEPTSKTVAIDQTWTAWQVCKKMMRKNDTEPDPNWVLIERIPQLSIGLFMILRIHVFIVIFMNYSSPNSFGKFFEGSYIFFTAIYRCTVTC